jgi:hypothetical protein
MGPLLTGIIGALIGKGLFKIGEKIISKKAQPQIVKDKLGLPDISDEKLSEVLANITPEQLDKLLDLERQIAVEDEVTERLRIDNEADSKFTRHVRPAMLVVLTVFYIGFCAFTTFALKDPAQRETGQQFGDQLMMLLIPIYGFYFGGRTLEKIKRMI